MEESSAVFKLLNNAIFSNVKYLNLKGSCINSEVLTSLSNSEHMTKLIYLNLSSTCRMAWDCIILSAGSSLTNLKELALENNNISLSGMSTILNSKQLSILRKLSISPADFLLDIYEKATPNANIETLILSRSTFSLELFEMINIKSLKHLDLSSTSLNDGHLQLISSSIYLSNLTSLNLDYNNLSDTGIIDFANSSILSNLEIISIRDNLIIFIDPIEVLQSKIPSLKKILI